MSTLQKVSKNLSFLNSESEDDCPNEGNTIMDCIESDDDEEYLKALHMVTEKKRKSLYKDPNGKWIANGKTSKGKSNVKKSKLEEDRGQHFGGIEESSEDSILDLSDGDAQKKKNDVFGSPIVFKLDKTYSVQRRMHTIPVAGNASDINFEAFCVEKTLPDGKAKIQMAFAVRLFPNLVKGMDFLHQKIYQQQQLPKLEEIVSSGKTFFDLENPNNSTFLGATVKLDSLLSIKLESIKYGKGEFNVISFQRNGRLGDSKKKPFSIGIPLKHFDALQLAIVALSKMDLKN